MQNGWYAYKLLIHLIDVGAAFENVLMSTIDSSASCQNVKCEVTISIYVLGYSCHKQSIHTHDQMR